MMKKMWMLSRTVVVAVVLGVVVTAPVQASSVCKGASRAKCAAKSGCTWVESYKTKNGTRVSGYCRAKPGKGVGKSSHNKPKKATAKGRDQKRKGKLTSGSPSAGKEARKLPAKPPKSSKTGAKKTSNKTH